MVSLIGGIKEEDKPEIRYAPRLPLRLIKPLLQDSKAAYLIACSFV